MNNRFFEKFIDTIIPIILVPAFIICAVGMWTFLLTLFLAVTRG